MSRARIWLISCVVVIVGACSPHAPRLGEVPGTRRDTVRAPDAGPVDGRSNAATKAKTVQSKSAPNTLIADDRTSCMIDINDFPYVNVGQKYTCVWSTAGTDHR